MIVEARYLSVGDRQYVSSKGKWYTVESVEVTPDLVVVTYVGSCAVRSYYPSDEVELACEMDLEETG